MKKLESSLFNMVAVLVVVALVMGGLLAIVNHVTEGPIQEQRLPMVSRQCSAATTSM